MSLPNLVKLGKKQNETLIMRPGFKLMQLEDIFLQRIIHLFQSAEAFPFCTNRWRCCGKMYCRNPTEITCDTTKLTAS